MTADRFWEIVQKACRSDSRSSERWNEMLTAELSTLPPDEIVEWNHFFDRFVARACTIDLMAACYVMSTGAGDDGFYYFRCWLVGMGREVYTKAIENADSLVSVALPFSTGFMPEAEIYAAAHAAWMQATGEPDTAPYPARNESAKLTGDDWDFDNPALMRQNLPKLSAFYDK
jgi:hypothetical protein